MRDYSPWEAVLIRGFLKEVKDDMDKNPSKDQVVRDIVNITMDKLIEMADVFIDNAVKNHTEDYERRASN